MGTDKATLDVGGRPLAATAVDALRGAGLEVVLVGSAGPDRAEAQMLVEMLDARFVPDELPGAGPLAAVATGLREAARRGREEVVVLACDLPAVEAETVRSLLGAAPGAPLVVATSGGQAAWPNGRWSTSLLVEIDSSILAGERGFRSLHERATFVELGNAVADVDRPGDLAGHPVRWP